MSPDDHDDSALDAHHCTEIYDTGAAAMGIWAAAHPSAPGALAGALALGTHLVGEAVCNGGIDLGPPPSYIDGKIGYDPAHDSPPGFGSDHPDAAAPDPVGGFDYSAPSDSGGGFDYSGDSSDSGTV
ncbi:hypothetical protein [Sphingomonas sp. KR3-1]|uniref:hypothetical protein n=1 Tax=Sphingomonas sp. KR3-1 TaxID=3156611 RepID=UPI0032B5666E